MPILHNPSSEEAKELRKWEQHHTKYSVDEEGTSKPGNPYVYRPYPAMVYRAYPHWNGSGKVICGDIGAFYDDQKSISAADTFTARCQLTVNDESEHKRALEDGWRESPQAAVAYTEQRERAIADETARRHFRDQSMSPEAQAEVAAVDASTHLHVPDPTKEQLAAAKGKSR